MHGQEPRSEHSSVQARTVLMGSVLGSGSASSAPTPKGEHAVVLVCSGPEHRRPTNAKKPPVGTLPDAAAGARWRGAQSKYRGFARGTARR